MENRKSSILTIGIPTYNRSQFLKKCLDYICPQLTEDVLVVVRDNCSENYDFKSFIAPYEEKYGVLAFQNKVNVGGDANIAKIYETCETKWLWVIGDDDYIQDDAVARVLQTIQENPDAIYVKFNSPYTGETKGLLGFCEAMKPHGAFAYSFFTSECLNNLETLNGYMFWHYRYLSTYCAQVLRVIKYLSNNAEAKCIFTSDEILLEHGAEISWCRFDIVPYQILLYDIFLPYKKMMRNNILRDITSYCLVYIDSAQISWREKWYYYSLVIHKYGLFNSFRYNYVELFRIPLRKVLNRELYSKLKHLVRKR